MKCTRVALEINEANDRGNNKNFKLITKATVKIATMANKHNNINNKKKNKNTNNNGNNDDNVWFLMTKILIIVIVEELVTVTIVTVIMMSYGWNSMERVEKNLT